MNRTDEAPGLLPVAGEREIYDIIGHEEIVREHTPQERDGAPLHRTGGKRRLEASPEQDGNTPWACVGQRKPKGQGPSGHPQG